MSVGCFLVKARTASGFVKESAFYEEKKKRQNYYFGTIIIPLALSLCHVPLLSEAGGSSKRPAELRHPLDPQWESPGCFLLLLDPLPG